jgi:hypothetical protein
MACGSYGTSPYSSTLIYGNAPITPLIGGSGGGGYNQSQSVVGGGAGGGAILIASSGDLSLNGLIQANGGSPYPGGSGGAIRLIANNVAGSGRLHAIGGSSSLLTIGGFGRIRVEAYTIDLTHLSVPLWTSSTPGPVFPLPGSPTLRAVSVNSVAVPDDPISGILTPDVEIATDQPVTINIEATNVPAGTTVAVQIVPEHGGGSIVRFC